jgi:hypothetical protein
MPCKIYLQINNNSLLFLQGLFRDLVGILLSVFIPARLKKTLQHIQLRANY